MRRNFGTGEAKNFKFGTCIDLGKSHPCLQYYNMGGRTEVSLSIPNLLRNAREKKLKKLNVLKSIAKRFFPFYRKPCSGVAPVIGLICIRVQEVLFMGIKLFR